MWGGEYKTVDLSECVWTWMAISLKQADIVMAQHTWTPSTNKKHTIDSHTKRKEPKHTAMEKLSNHIRKNKKKWTKNYKINQKTRFKKAINTYLIIALNINGINAPIKRHRVADWRKKQEPTICCLQETHFWAKDTHKLKVRGWKKMFHANGNDKKAGVAILISDKL